MNQPKDQIEQDAIAAEWGVALDPDAATALAAAPSAGGAGGNDAIPQWTGPGEEGAKFSHGGGKGGTERVLSQEEIDGLLGFSLSDVSLSDNSGIRAIIDTATVS